MPDDDVLVFDTGPLTHFAREGWPGVLKAVVGERTAVVPDVVVEEIKVGAKADSRLEAVLKATWIERRELQSSEEIEAFATFAARLVRGRRNAGEAGVLALALTMNGIAVIDDGAGRKAAADHNIKLQPTLALLCEAVRAKLLTVSLVSCLADDLLASQYRLPFAPGEFAKWAIEKGQLDE